MSRTSPNFPLDLGRCGDRYEPCGARVSGVLVLGGVPWARSVTTAAYSANNRGNHDGRLFAGIARGEGFAGSPVDVNPVERVAPFE
jgi:hypothetical protein